MGRISINDALGVEVVSANPQVNSGFGKYLKGTASALLAGTDVATQLRTPFNLANAGESGLGLTWKNAFPLGNGDVALTAEAGAHATIGVYNRTGMVLLGGTFLGPPLKVPAGNAFVSFAARTTLGLGVKQGAGSLSFGFTAGSESEIQCFRPVSLNGDSPTLGAVTKDLFEHFVIPNTADDLRQMKALPAGTLACASGSGRLQVGATVDVAAAFNPLASVSTLPRLGALTVVPTATASVGVKASVSGGYQIRVQRLEGPGARVRLSVHTSAGRGLEVSLNATAGTGITLGERNLLGMLFQAPGGLPDAAREDLVAGGISSAQLDRLTAVMKGALSRRIELSLAAQFASLRQDEAAFVYDIDLDTIDDAASSAIDRALTGDLGALNELEPEMPAHGVSVIRSGMKTLREKKVQWRISLVGLVNVLSIRDLVRTGTVTHDQESGELVVTDKITNDQVGAVMGPRQLRKMLYESTMITLTYKAAGLDVNRELSASQAFFMFDRRANHQRMSDFLDAVEALGLTTPGNSSTVLGGDDEFGGASLYLETTYSQAAAEKAFGFPGNPPDESAYEAIGRNALLALVTDDDPDSYRRIPLADATLWQKMKEAGQPNFKFILPSPITGGPDAREALRVAVVAADYTLIVWWASAMALAAKRLAEMRKFLNGKNAADLNGDKAFTKRRTELEEAMVKAIRKNTSSFDDPWGLVALFMASGATAEAAATVVSQKLVLALPE